MSNEDLATNQTTAYFRSSGYLSLFDCSHVSWSNIRNSVSELPQPSLPLSIKLNRGPNLPQESHAADHANGHICSNSRPRPNDGDSGKRFIKPQKLAVALPPKADPTSQVTANKTSHFIDLEKRIITCERCRRLVRYRRDVAKRKRKEFQDWDYWGRPLPGFGSKNAKLLILGLAPAAHGGNRTGRVFTGDPSAQFLFQHLYAVGLANHPYSLSREDGLELKDTYLTAAVKCVPPENRPTFEERANCSQYLAEELRLQESLQVVLVLGGFAFEAYKRFLTDALKLETMRLKFSHGAVYRFRRGVPSLFASYHPSPHNTNTGRLTSAMFREVLEKIKVELNQAGKASESKELSS